MNVICNVCPRSCSLKEGQLGFCRARMAEDGKVISVNYGQVASLALDPIEKKPLYHFSPGSKILSVGSFGCNLRCPFCQNFEISMSDGTNLNKRYLSSEQLAHLAEELQSQGNIGVAYTYNEPLIGYEYVLDSSRLVHQYGLKNVIVTNGYIQKHILKELLPYIDAVNMDLKSFNPTFYKGIGGDLEVIKRNIELVAKSCHLEITTLVIEGENDMEKEIAELASWIASIDPSIPLHISRFFPAYQYKDRNPTPVSTIYQLVEVAKNYLQYVFPGNC